MAEQPVIKSKPWGGIALVPLIGGVFFGVFCAWLLSGAIINGYPQALPIISGSLFGILALLCLGSLYYQGGYFAIFADRLVVYSFLRTKIKTIFISDIINWKEEQYDDEGKAKILTVFTAGKKYKITSDDDEYDYGAVKKLLTLGNPGTSVAYDKQEAGNAQKRSTNKVMFVFYGIVAVFCSWLVFSGMRSYFYPNNFKDLSLTEIGGAIVSTPEAHKGSGRGDYSYVRFDLKDYPKIHFCIENAGYDATSKPLLYKLKPGDSVFLKIPTEDYQKKITNEQPLSLADKTDASNTILVYEFRDRAFSYLNLDSYKAANAADGNYGPLIALLGLAVLLLTMRDWRKRAKK